MVSGQGAAQVRRLNGGRSVCEDLPDVLLTKVFSRLPARSIVVDCAAVSRAWRDAAKDSLLWAELCEGTGLRSCDEIRLQGWRSLYIAVFTPNLLASPFFESLDQTEVDRIKKQLREGPWQVKHRILLDRIHTEGDTGEDFHMYSHWAVEGGSQFQRGGGDGITREQPPLDCPVCPAAPEAAVVATSYDWGRVQQYVGLQSFSNKFLDESPPLAFSAWYAGCNGVEGSFRMYLVMRDELKNCIIIWDSGVLTAIPGQWQQAKFLIKGYPTGLRTMVVKLSGKSTSHLRGTKGTKFTAAKVHFVPFSQLHFYSDYNSGTLVPPST